MSEQTAFHPQISTMTDQWMELFGYLAPSVVRGTDIEYHAVRERAGLMDFSMLRKVDLVGTGAVDLVNSVVTRDIRKLRPGQIAYGALTDEGGKMVDDCTASVFGPDRVRFCGANDRDYTIFDAAAQGREVTVSELTDSLAHLCVQGPLSREILQPLMDRSISNEEFPYYTFVPELRCAGIPVFMTRLGYTAELGFELWSDRDDAGRLWDVLMDAGRPAGMELIGMDALDLLRIEGGFIIGGVEYDETVSPYECGLGWTVDLDKGPFSGREALAADRETSELRLCSVVLDDGGPEASGAVLRVGDEEAGAVTQAVSSPLLGGATLGLAKLRRPHHQRGTRVTAVVGGREVAGEVVAHPAYDPKRTRAKETS